MPTSSVWSLQFGAVLRHPIANALLLLLLKPHSTNLQRSHCKVLGWPLEVVPGCHLQFLHAVLPGRVLMRSQRWLLWVCIPERAPLIITSMQFFVQPDPVGGPQHGDTLLQYLLWSKFGGSWSKAQMSKCPVQQWVILAKCVSPEHSSSSCAVSYLLRKLSHACEGRFGYSSLSN